MYYKRGSVFGNSDTQFTEFLEGLWSLATPAWRVEAVAAAVSQLVQPPKQERGAIYVATIRKGEVTVQFTNPSVRLLYTLIPRVRETNIGLARTLLAKYPELRVELPEQGLPYSSALVLHDAAKDLAVTKQRLEARELGYLKELAKTDGAGAIRTAGDMMDPGNRSEAFASPAAALHKQVPYRSIDLLDRSWDDMSKITDHERRLSVLASITEAASTVGDISKANEASRRGLDLGQELFEEFNETHPACPADQIPILGDYAKLVQLLAERDLRAAKRYVLTVENEPLRALLLVSIAERLSSHEKARSLPKGGNRQ